MIRFGHGLHIQPAGTTLLQHPTGGWRPCIPMHGVLAILEMWALAVSARRNPRRETRPQCPTTAQEPLFTGDVASCTSRSEFLVSESSHRNCPQDITLVLEGNNHIVVLIPPSDLLFLLATFPYWKIITEDSKPQKVVWRLQFLLSLIIGRPQPQASRSLGRRSKSFVPPPHP